MIHASSQVITRLIFSAPIRIVSEANNRQHWTEKNKRKIDQSLEILAAYHNAARGKSVQLPVVVTLRRVGPKALDSDNLANGFKACQDQIARMLKIDDGDRTKVRWVYEQRAIGKREYSVEVEINSI